MAEQQSRVNDVVAEIVVLTDPVRDTLIGYEAKSFKRIFKIRLPFECKLEKGDIFSCTLYETKEGDAHQASQLRKVEDYDHRVKVDRGATASVAIKTLVVATPEIMEHNVMFAEDFGFLKYDQDLYSAKYSNDHIHKGWVKYRPHPASDLTEDNFIVIQFDEDSDKKKNQGDYDYHINQVMADFRNFLIRKREKKYRDISFSTASSTASSPPKGSRDRRYDDDDLPGPSSRNGNGSDLANLKPSKALEHEAFTRRRMMTRKELHQELLDKGNGQYLLCLMLSDPNAGLLHSTDEYFYAWTNELNGVFLAVTTIAGTQRTIRQGEWFLGNTKCRKRMWVDGVRYENEIEVERIMALSYVSWPLTISSNKNEIVMTIETPMKEIHSDGRVLVDRIGYVEFPKEIIYKYEGKRIVANYAISNYSGHWGVWQLKSVLRVLGVHERFEDYFQPRVDYTDGVINDTNAITNQVSDAEDDDGDDDPYDFGSRHCSGRDQAPLAPDAFDDEDDYNQPIGWSLHNDDNEKRNGQCGAGAYPDRNRDEWKDRNERNDRNGEFNNWTPVGPVGFGGTQGWNERSNLHNRLAYRDEERRSSPSSRPSKYADALPTRNVSRFSAPDVDQVPFGSMSISSGSRSQANQGNQAPPPQVPGPSTILGPAGPDMTRPRSRHQAEPEPDVQLPPPRRATPEQDIGVVVEIGSNYLIVAVPYRGACIYEAAFFDANLKQGQFVHVVIEKLPRPGRECCEFSILEEPRLVAEEMDLPVTRVNQKSLVEVLVRGTIRLDKDRNAYFESNVIDHILIDRAKARSLKLIGVQDIEALCYFYFNDELNQWQWDVDSYYDTKAKQHEAEAESAGPSRSFQTRDRIRELHLDNPVQFLDELWKTYGVKEAVFQNNHDLYLTIKRYMERK